MSEMELTDTDTMILSGGFERLGGTDVEAAQGGRAHRRGNQRGGEVSRIKANEGRQKDRQKERHKDKKTDTQTDIHSNY